MKRFFAVVGLSTLFLGLFALLAVLVITVVHLVEAGAVGLTRLGIVLQLFAGLMLTPELIGPARLRHWGRGVQDICPRIRQFIRPWIRWFEELKLPPFIDPKLGLGSSVFWWICIMAVFGYYAMTTNFFHLEEAGLSPTTDLGDLFWAFVVPLMLLLVLMLAVGFVWRSPLRLLFSVSDAIVQRITTRHSSSIVVPFTKGAIVVIKHALGAGLAFLAVPGTVYVLVILYLLVELLRSLPEPLSLMIAVTALSTTIGFVSLIGGDRFLGMVINTLEGEESLRSIWFIGGLLFFVIGTLLQLVGTFPIEPRRHPELVNQVESEGDYALVALDQDLDPAGEYKLVVDISYTEWCEECEEVVVTMLTTYSIEGETFSTSRQYSVVDMEILPLEKPPTAALSWRVQVVAQPATKSKVKLYLWRFK